MGRLEPSALITYVLVMLFGSSAWISVNGTWIELPLMVNVLPEGWNLPSYLAMIVQIAFVGPLIYAVMKKLFPYAAQRSPRLAALSLSSFGKNFTPTPLIYATLIVAVLCHLLLAVFWNRTTVWPNGVEHSTTLFVLFFFVSMVNCLSNVLYLPYMYRFRPTYTTAYFIGMGFSALVPSILGLVQGSGRIDCVWIERSVNNTTSIFNESAIDARPVSPLFGVDVYNGMLCVWLSIVVIGFYFLNRLPQLQNEREAGEDEKRIELEKSPDDGNEHQDETRRLSESAPAGDGDNGAVEKPTAVRGQSAVLSRSTYLYLLAITAWVCALMNGVLPSIQSFATLPYGQLTYHLAVTISNLANPVACFVPFFIRVRRISFVISIWTIIGTLLSAYLLTAAAWSPTALLESGTGAVGPALSIICWTLVTGIWAYVRTVIAGILRESGDGGTKSENRLFWCGLFTQVGALVGAMVIFPLVNVKQIFKAAPMCPE